VNTLLVPVRLLMRFLLKLLTVALPLFTSGNAERIVRFISDDGKTYHGDAILPHNTTDAFFSTSARVIQGDILGDFTVTNVTKVSELLIRSVLPVVQ
jgi:hypothetical protein